MAEAAKTPERVRLRVLDAWDETHSLRALAVALGPAAGQHRTPGQVVKLHTPDHGDGFFALASAPSGDGRAELLVKRGGAVADEVIAAAATGAALDATPPFGAGFPLDRAAGRDVLLLAAGSGIAPIRAIVQHVLARRADYGRVALFYGHRHATEFAYRREHAAWRAAGVAVTLCCSAPADGWTGARGHVQRVAVEAALGGVDPGTGVAFLCGGREMVVGAREALGAAGLSIDRTFLNF